MNSPDLLSPAQRLNADCHCVSLDRAILRRELLRAPGGAALADMIEADRPHLFSGSAVFVDSEHVERMAEIVAAIERVIALPEYRAHVLAYAPVVARHQPKARGVFLGYDFHLGKTAGGPQLIEINTNAGGGLLNALLARAHQACCDMARAVLPGMVGGDAPEHLFMEMFRAEWRAEHGEQPLSSIAIVDESPEQQFLYPEFVLFRQLFERHGIAATICAPDELEWRDAALWHAGRRIDLVYNRLTDFSLSSPSSSALREAWLAGGAVVTPHPHAYALYADKRNLVALSDDALLASWGVDPETRALLAAGIPHTENVAAKDADALWSRRRQLFFKPAMGYGSKAAYRGDKLTRRVFEEILAGDYVAQTLVPPSSRKLAPESEGGDALELKLDLRNYVYAGAVQLVAARLWQGQTTNFRTPGGGFAPVLAVPCMTKVKQTL
jgi:hypothetical protein